MAGQSRARLYALELLNKGTMWVGGAVPLAKARAVAAAFMRASAKARRVSPLTEKDVAALIWAHGRAEEWFGSITGDSEAEAQHREYMGRVRGALAKLGITIKGSGE